jgi:hypothetical protein
MTRLSPDRNQLLDKLVTDCITFRLDQKESLEYIKDWFGEISRKTLSRRKTAILDDESTRIWLSNFTRIGFVKNLKKQMDDIERIQEDSQKQLYLEMKKEPRDNRLILMLKNDIRQNSMLLAEYGLSTPIIAQLKERLKKKKVDTEEDEQQAEAPIPVTK